MRLHLASWKSPSSRLPSDQAASRRRPRRETSVSPAGRSCRVGRHARRGERWGSSRGVPGCRSAVARGVGRACRDESWPQAASDPASCSPRPSRDRPRSTVRSCKMCSGNRGFGSSCGYGGVTSLSAPYGGCAIRTASSSLSPRHRPFEGGDFPSRWCGAWSEGPPPAKGGSILHINLVAFVHDWSCRHNPE